MGLLIVDFESNTVTSDGIINCLTCDQGIDYCICNNKTDETSKKKFLIPCWDKCKTMPYCEFTFDKKCALKLDVKSRAK